MNTSTTSLASATASSAAAADLADHLFFVLAGENPLAPSWRFCLRDVHKVILTRGPVTRAERSAGGRGPVLTVTLSHRFISKPHAVLVRGSGGWLLVDDKSKNGTRKNGELITRAVLADRDTIEIGQCLLLFRSAVQLVDDAAPFAVPAPSTSGEAYPATLLPGFESELADLRVAVAEAAPVLLLGETGTGKEGAARAVHAWSARSGAFVAVNCGAIPANLIESELFGYVRGAFSGATSDRAGLIKTAQHGTLFLDEVGDLPPAAQLALLRVLQEREVWPIGARRGVPIDVCVISATNRDLAAMVARGEFRADLYARIAGFTLALPPLRERREDLGLLVAALLRRHRPHDAESAAFTPEAARALFGYRWPYNIRELEQALRLAVPLARGAPIDVRHLPPAVRASSPPDTARQVRETSATTLEARRRAQLGALLNEHAGNISAVAREMGCTRARIYRWIDEYGLGRARAR